MPTWIDAFPLAALPEGGARTVKHDGLQVAVFHLAGGRLRAVDNRCPHEGYPLSQGAVSADGCTLTCQWHNWRFALDDGACLKGGEAVRSVPVRVVEGTVQLDLAPPDPAPARARRRASLAQALREHDVGRATRDAVRLLQLGEPPAAIAAAAAAHDGRHAEWGATHGLPVAADVLRLLDRYPGPRAAIPLAQALDVASYAHAWRPARALAPPEDPGPDPAAAGAELARRVEAEQAEAAEALLRGALARGWGRAELEPWLYALVAAHHLDSGHRLIYQVKAWDLLAAAGPDHAEDILCGHLYGIVNGTREDLLPSARPLRRALEGLDLDRLWAIPRDPGWRRQPLEEALVEGAVAEALAATVAALEAGAPLPAVVDAISLAAAERLLRFDVAIDADPGVQDGWLSVTHTQTHAAALRHALVRWSDPRLLRLVLHSAWFISHHRALDGARPDLTALAEPADTLALLAAIDRRDSAAALAIARARPPGLEEALLDRAVADVAGAPIVQAHLLKNTLVGLDEARATGDPRPLLALVRLLASPIQQRWVHRGALEAIALVTEGRVPRLLAP